MQSRLTLLVATSIGAVAMYYLDPARGRYRRALVRDQVVHAGHKTQRGLRAAGRDMRNRAVGGTAIIRSFFDFEQPDDRVLAERVHACVGRVVTHPGSIDVKAGGGVVTLSGPILEDEVPLLMDCVLGVHGVKGVQNQLEVHSEAARVPGLQGRPERQPGERAEFLQTNWSPAARVVGGLAGVTTSLYALGRRRGAWMIPRLLLATAGLLVLTRAATNLELRRLFGVGAPRRAIDVEKAIRIQAPVEKVAKLWESFENFPSFMTHVLRVRPLEGRDKDKRWRWTVRGPTGLEFEFDSVVTEREENRLLAWRTEPGALVQHAGRVYFRANADGSTTVDVKMVYNPVAGAVGHVIAWLFGADPKHQMHADLMRMKTFVETGKPPRDAARPMAEIPSPEKEKRVPGNGSGERAAEKEQP